MHPVLVVQNRSGGKKFSWLVFHNSCFKPVVEAILF
jgi:hypothetical protein